MSNDRYKPVLVICGPTASGKTRIGIEVAKKMNGEIISADARQFYKMMSIGTAQPSLEERAEIPHHLVGFADINNHISAADFRKLAIECIENIYAQGNLPIFVGGSGLYIRALEEGFFEGPKRDSKYRLYLENKIEKEGIETIYRKLEKLDPETATRLHPNDRARIVRALEVYRSTGRSITALQKEGKYPQTDYDFIKIGIRLRRDTLYQRINERVLRMVEDGLIAEVKMVYENLRPQSSHLFKTLAYREFKGYLDGEYDLDRAVYLTQLHTRHYAKRQMTWFRADKDIKWFNPEKIGVVDRIVRYFRNRIGI